MVVISDRLWRSAFAGAPDAIGKVMRMNGVPHTVVGVMPDGFALPPDIEAWLPFDLPNDAWTRIVGARQLFVFGRLAEGRSNAEAQEELKAFGRRAEEASTANKDWSYASQPVRPYYLGGADNTILLVQAGALILLLLAASNLSSLLLAWAVERERETALRLALGAGGARHRAATRGAEHPPDAHGRCSGIAPRGGGASRVAGAQSDAHAVLLPPAAPDGSFRGRGHPRDRGPRGRPRRPASPPTTCARWGYL